MVKIDGQVEKDYGNNSNSLSIKYAEFDIELTKKSVNNKENLIFDINNTSKYDTMCKIVVKNYDGEKLYVTNEFMVKGYGENSITVCLDYELLKIEKNQRLYFEIESDIAQMSNAGIYEYVKGFEKIDVLNNDILRLLDIAKRLLL